MGYEPVVIDQFGGLVDDYRSTDRPGAMRTAANVVLGPRGRSVRARLGFDTLTASAAATPYAQTYTHSDSKLLARRTTTLAAVNTAGSEATTTTVANAFMHTARFGTPSASYSYIADGATELIRYDGTNFSSGATSATVDGVAGQPQPIGKFLTVTGSSNRLVVAGTTASGGPDALASSGSHVWFSDPGSGETWTSTNYVQLDPGDGESIVGCVTWRDQVFVFKQTKMYVFYSETTASDGTPIFNYRSVHLGPRADVLAPTTTFGNPAIASAPEGIYFLGSSGIWLTTGDVPTSVSDPAIFAQTYDPSPTLGITAGFLASAAGLHYHLGRLYVNISTLGGVQLVYDAALGEWFPWAANVKGFGTWKAGGSEPLLVSGSTATNDIMKWANTSAQYTDDNGTAITSGFYTTWMDLGLPGEKTVREIEIWGGGTVSVTLYKDFNESSGTTTSLNLGTASGSLASTRGFVRVAVQGNLFALAISASSYFRIDRVIFHLRDAKNVGAKSS